MSDAVIKTSQPEDKYGREVYNAAKSFFKRIGRVKDVTLTTKVIKADRRGWLVVLTVNQRKELPPNTLEVLSRFLNNSPHDTIYTVKVVRGSLNVPEESDKFALATYQAAAQYYKRRGLLPQQFKVSLIQPEHHQHEWSVVAAVSLSADIPYDAVGDIQKFVNAAVRIPRYKLTVLEGPTEKQRIFYIKVTQKR